MKYRITVLLALLVVVSSALTACKTATKEEPYVDKPALEESTEFECNDDIGCVEIAPDEPIHIAYLLTVSGATAFLGEDSKGAIEIAIDDRGGELLGHEIILSGEDSQCNAEGGKMAASIIATDSTILGVIGTNCSSAATAAIPIISDAGLVMLAPSNTFPSLTLEGKSWQPGYFRICYSDLIQGLVAAEFAADELGAVTAATIHDGSPYAENLQAMFASHFAELGGEVTSQVAVKIGETDMRPILTSIAAALPDLLYLPVFEPEGAFIVAQSSEIAGLENTILMGADGLMANSFPENAGVNAIGMYLTGLHISGDAYDEFLGKWDAKFSSAPPSGFHAFAYDGASILFEAIETISVVEADGTIHIGRQSLRDAITGITYYRGLSGILDCSDNDYSSFGIEYANHGDCNTGSGLGIFKITEAEVEGNWPPQTVFLP